MGILGYDEMIIINMEIEHLVGGAITILKNDGVRQWEG